MNMKYKCREYINGWVECEPPKIYYKLKREFPEGMFTMVFDDWRQEVSFQFAALERGYRIGGINEEILVDKADCKRQLTLYKSLVSANSEETYFWFFRNMLAGKDAVINKGTDKCKLLYFNDWFELDLTLKGSFHASRLGI